MLQTVYVDRLLGRVLARLKRVGLYDRAALVVTADHGIAFQSGSDPRLAIPPTLGEIGGVPLFMKAPGQRRGRIDDRNIHTVDVLPMLASQLELKLPWKTDDRPAPGEWHDVAVATPFRTITRMSFPEWLRLRDAAARRIHGSFGPGVEGLFQLGVDGELVGRSVRDFPAQPANALRADLDTFGQLDDVDPTASPLPVAVSGTLEGATQSHERLAISLNGIVAGTTHSHKVGDDVVFNAVVLPSTLRAGSNTVEVWAIRDGSNGPALAPLRTVQPKTYDLVERDNHDSVDTPSGKVIPVVPGAAKGYIDVLDQAGGTTGSLTVAGWALDSHDTPVNKLVVFEGNRFLGVSLPGTERPDIAKLFGAEALKSGFSLEVPAAGLYGPDVRVFAIAGDQASELKRGESLDSAN
jgi:hypothetical protein